MKTILIRRKLVTKPWNTSAFYHAPQKGPIGCKLVIIYAKSQKLSYLISSFTDMRLTTNHTITSKETCGKFLAQHQKRRRMRMFTMRIIHGPRRKLHHYFLSLISAENRKLISFYLSINKYEIYNERSNSLNKSNKN